MNVNKPRCPEAGQQGTYRSRVAENGIECSLLIHTEEGAN